MRVAPSPAELKDLVNLAKQPDAGKRRQVWAWSLGFGSSPLKNQALTKLPPELIARVFSFSSLRDVVTISSTCKLLRSLLDDDVLLLMLHQTLPARTAVTTTGFFRTRPRSHALLLQSSLASSTSVNLDFEVTIPEFKVICHELGQAKRLQRLVITGDVKLTPDKVLILAKALSQTPCRQLVFSNLALLVNLPLLIMAAPGAHVYFESCAMDASLRQSIVKVGAGRVTGL